MRTLALVALVGNVLVAAILRDWHAVVGWALAGYLFLAWGRDRREILEVPRHGFVAGDRLEIRRRS